MTIEEIQDQITLLQSELMKLRIKGRAEDEAKVTVWQEAVKLFQYTIFHGKGTSLSHIIGSLTRISDPVISQRTTIIIEVQE